MGKIVENVYYASIDENEIKINPTNIVKIVIPEGVEKIPAWYISDFPDLEIIEFPSTLKSISKSSITRCHKLRASGLKFKNSDFVIQSKTSIKSDESVILLDEYIENIFKAFDSKDISFDEIYNIYNQIVFSMDENQQKRFFIKFKVLFASFNIGLKKIIDKLNSGIILNMADLQCFAILLQQKMSLPSNPTLIEDYNQKICCAGADGLVSVGYESIILSARKKLNSNNPAAINIYMLYAMCHEFQHIRQKNNSFNIDYNCNDIFKLIDFIDSSLQSTSDLYDMGKTYSKFHDFFPDEIRADVEGYEILISIFDNQNDIIYLNEMIDYIKQKRKDRIIRAHQINNNVAEIPDYRLFAFDKLLGRADLSDSERTKVNELKTIYLKTKKKAEIMKIDLFQSTLGWYDENYNNAHVIK